MICCLIGSALDGKADLMHDISAILTLANEAWKDPLMPRLEYLELALSNVAQSDSLQPNCKSS